MILRRAPRSSTEPTAPSDCSIGSESQHLEGGRRSGARLLIAGVIATVGVTGTSGCYNGEWRTGVEVPVNVTARLLPTRTVETWELSQTTVPYVVQIKGTQTPRCHMALYGKSRRTDTGQFERTGGTWWKALAIVTGIAGGFGVGFGAGGYVPQLVDPTYGRPIMYAAGSGLVVGGLVGCFMALSRPTKVRQAFCGLLTGLGGAVLAGSVMSTLPSAKVAPTAGQMTVPLIDPMLYQQILLAGAGLSGAAVATGVIANLWQGTDDRVRVVDVNNASLWDQQQPEQSCGATKPLMGRTVGVEIVAENAVQGLGSEAQPLKLRVAIGTGATQPLDLTPVRQALPSCGSLTVRIIPDVVYERYTEDYTPPVPPDLMHKAAQPVFGHILPAEGLTLPIAEGRQRQVGKQGIPGVSVEALARVERHCRGEADPVPGPKPIPPRRPVPMTPTQPAQPQQPAQPPGPPGPPDATQPPAPVEPAQPEPVQPVAPRSNEPVLTPGLTLPQRSLDQPAEGDCSMEVLSSRARDCENQCGKALSLMPCVMDFRKCAIEARYSDKSERDRALCELGWEQCLYKAGVSTGSWRRCAEGCVEVNDPPQCKYKPPRLTP